MLQTQRNLDKSIKARSHKYNYIEKSLNFLFWLPNFTQASSHLIYLLTIFSGKSFLDSYSQYFGSYKVSTRYWSEVFEVFQNNFCFLSFRDYYNIGALYSDTVLGWRLCTKFYYRGEYEGVLLHKWNTAKFLCWGFNYGRWLWSYQRLTYFHLLIQFSLISLVFSHGYSYPQRSPLDKPTDNKFICLTNPLWNKYSLTYPTSVKIRDDSKQNLWCFPLSFVKTQFTLDYNLFLAL